MMYAPNESVALYSQSFFVCSVCVLFVLLFSIPECSSSAANAICLLCKSCSIHIGEPVLTLYDQLIAQEVGCLSFDY